MAFDSANTPTTCRPGERLIRGEPVVFNADILNRHLAYEAVLSAPADLTSLDYEAVNTLAIAAGRIASATDRDVASLPYPVDFALAERVCARASAERDSRPEYQAVFGRKVA